MSILFFLLAACNTPCTDLAAASVSVTLTDNRGEKVDDATVTFTVDGGEAQACESFSAGEYICGWEQEGHVVVTASAEGYADVTGEADVAADECHVIEEHLDLALGGIDCGSEEPVGVLLSVLGAEHELLNGTWATWSADGGATSDCIAGEDDVFHCGDVSGEYLLTAGADGHKDGTATAMVVMDASGCGPGTETARITLEWLPD